MKKFLLFIGIILYTVTYSQVSNDTIIKSTGTNVELFSKTNMYINEVLPEHKNISIENDKFIYISDKFVKTVKASTWNIDYTFYFTVKFYHKNDSIKIVYTLESESKSTKVYQNSSGTTLSVISGSRPMYTELNEKNSAYKNIDVTKEFPGYMKCGYGREKYEDVCLEILNTSKDFFNDYVKYISKTKVNEGW